MTRKDDRQAQLTRHYTAYGPMVLRRCRALLRDDEDALEASQEIFVKLLEKFDRLDLESSPSSLLYRMATNHCLNRLRARRLRASHGVAGKLLQDFHRKAPQILAAPCVDVDG